MSSDETRRMIDSKLPSGDCRQHLFDALFLLLTLSPWLAFLLMLVWGPLR
ncbi:MAG TPA: hypothetical protein PKJ41_06535 [Bryobacteraceae bacterium]|nr:hypothetical protein [Bryobacteraceae bacterium]HPT26596.1 hypothetical protein [Bryobacteraceae bacterium]